MGIKVEFNSDLALRDIAEFKAGRRKVEECIPEKLKVGNVYTFLKKEQRIYWFEGEISLIETTTRGGTFSQSVANVKLIEVTHFIEKGEVCTKGKYKVVKVFTTDKKVLVKGCKIVKK
ncbi:MAG: hypothetical protein UT50_C0030G0007 [Candidatus Moranbacteria bacterium GW2011_GWA2_39_41]|nr:MAG: hypothetical protein UT50_C0030G0007 [Candidatus Moranbacteria bacterium GW2011_GWA2_39_41]